MTVCVVIFCIQTKRTRHAYQREFSLVKVRIGIIIQKGITKEEKSINIYCTCDYVAVGLVATESMNKWIGNCSILLD